MRFTGWTPTQAELDTCRHWGGVVFGVDNHQARIGEESTWGGKHIPPSGKHTNVTVAQGTHCLSFGLALGFLVQLLFVVVDSAAASGTTHEPSVLLGELCSLHRIR